MNKNYFPLITKGIISVCDNLLLRRPWMKFLRGVIVICSAFWMHTYLYYSDSPKTSFCVYAVVLFLIGIYAIVMSFKENEH